MAPLAQALHEYDMLGRKRAPRGSLRRLRAANKEAELAQYEIDNGFPLLNAHALVGFWGALESLIEDVVVAFLVNEPKLLSGDRLARLRVPLADFESLTREERMRRVVTLLQREMGGLAGGIAPFEQSLALVALSGEVPDDVRRTLWEAGNLRNVIVHRMSVADQRLIDACPWLGYTVGEKVVVKDVFLYFRAMVDYNVILVNRVRVHFGLGPYKHRGLETDALAGDAPG
jgi:hypothetical protein